MCTVTSAIINVPANQAHGDSTIDFRERARGRCRCYRRRGHSTRRGTDRKGGRTGRTICLFTIAAAASAARRNDRGIGPVGEVLVHGIAISRAEPPPLAGLEKIPVIMLRARRIRRSRMVGTGTPCAGPVVRATAAAAETLPLLRKIASSGGIAEIVLLEVNNGAWMRSRSATSR